MHHNLLIVHPNQAAALRTAYAENLDMMLKSAGVELISNPHVAASVFGHQPSPSLIADTEA